MLCNSVLSVINSTYIETEIKLKNVELAFFMFVQRQSVLNFLDVAIKYRKTRIK